MKILMDADCLIKLTKARLKEAVCAAFEVEVPSWVCREVIRNASEHPECIVIAENLANGLLREVAVPDEYTKGEDSTLAVYRTGGYEGIASDDKRFVRKLRLLGIPYFPAAVLLLLLVKAGHMTVVEGSQQLERLAPMVSDDEVVVVKLKLESFSNKG